MSGCRCSVRSALHGSKWVLEQSGEHEYTDLTVLRRFFVLPYLGEVGGASAYPFSSVVLLLHRIAEARVGLRGHDSGTAFGISSLLHIAGIRMDL